MVVAPATVTGVKEDCGCAVDETNQSPSRGVSRDFRRFGNRADWLHDPHETFRFSPLLISRKNSKSANVAPI